MELTSTQIIFLGLHCVTWILLVMLYSEFRSWKREIRLHINYDNTLRARRRELKNGDNIK